MVCIEEKIKKLERMIFSKDERALLLLKEVGRELLAEPDYAKNGRFLYLQALASYHFGFMEKFYGQVQSAVSHLIRCEEHGLLSRCYNLFAVNAQRYGILDVAYNYYLLAASFAEEEKDAIEQVIVHANLGDLLAEMGEFKKAAACMRRCILMLKKHRDHPSYHEYLMIWTLNLGLYNLSAGEIKKSEQVMKRAEKLMETVPKKVREGTGAWMQMLRIQCALATGDGKRKRALLNEAVETVFLQPQFSDLMNDVYRFCTELIACGEEEGAMRLIQSLEQNQQIYTSAYIRVRFLQLKIGYYKSRRQYRKLKECYETRRVQTKLIETERRRLYAESVKLMDAVVGLAREQELVRQENKKLQAQAEADALTGLPNRFALNRTLEESFRKAKEKKGLFGVGIVDIDSFKEYNDRFGHLAGDECLVAVADALRSFGEQYGIPCFRYGGDEFVLLYGDMEREAILRLEQEIKENMPVSVSHGFEVVRAESGVKVWDALSGADASMYRNKKKRG
ncbi:MAG: diguanylate cyclase [Lachnospiraceae bacterium]|nr:diguanylate cyclase [Lachnospiraceae bacterium]